MQPRKKVVAAKPDQQEECDGLESIKVAQLFELDKESENKLQTIASEAEKVFKDTSILELAAFSQVKVEPKLLQKPKKRSVATVYSRGKPKRTQARARTTPNFSVRR